MLTSLGEQDYNVYMITTTDEKGMGERIEAALKRKAKALSGEKLQEAVARVMEKTNVLTPEQIEKLAELGDPVCGDVRDML